MKKFFSKYLRFLGTIFLFWLLVLIAKKLGIDFRVDLSIFFRIFLLLFVPLIIKEKKKIQFEIWPTIKNKALRAKDRFLAKAEKMKKENLSFSSQELTGKTGGVMAIISAFISIASINFQRFLEKHILETDE